MMNRRDFVKFLGVIAAGAAALPEQIAAFEAYYEANTPITAEPLVAIDDLWLCGMANRSLRVKATFFDRMSLALNAFGGILRWTAQPDSKIILTRRNVTWDIQAMDGEDTFNAVLTGCVSYIDQDKIRHSFTLQDWRGSL